MLDAAADAHMERNPGTCLDTSGDIDVLLWEIPARQPQGRQARRPGGVTFDVLGFSRTARRLMDGTAYYPPLDEPPSSEDHYPSDASAAVASG